MTPVPGSVPLWLTALFVVQVLVMAGLVVCAVGARRGVGAAVGPGLALGGWLAVTGLLALGRLLDETPPGWLVHPRSFRIVMEIILWQLFVAGAAPAIMTFEGRNVDILVGLTAPLVAWLCFTRRVWSPRVAMWWNVAGVAILANVVVHAQLAAPTPFRVFHVQPPVTFIAYVPWIWLPGFLVPLAWALHALSMRQLRRKSSAGRVGYADAR